MIIMSKKMLVVGKISVKAILETRKREIETVYIIDSKKDKETRYILSQTKGLDVKRVTRDELDALTGITSHGGFAVSVGNRQSESVEDIMKNAKSVLVVEGVSDPFNMGEILRTVYTLGFEAVITPQYDFYEHEAKLIRASAGASEHILWLQSDNLKEDITKMKQDFSIIAAHRDDESHELTTYNFDEKVVIMLGGALRGLSKDILDLSDATVRLDYKNRMALSTQGAASVFAYARMLNVQKGQ